MPPGRHTTIPCAQVYSKRLWICLPQPVKHKVWRDYLGHLAVVDGLDLDKVRNWDNGLEDTLSILGVPARTCKTAQSLMGRTW